MKQIKFTFLILILSSFFSCSISKELREERKQWGFSNWNIEFKNRAFCLCQLKGFENNVLERNLWNNDRSYYNVLGIAIFDDSLTNQINIEIESIRLDSIKYEGKYPEDLKQLLQKREVINHCLDFYNSERLQRLTKRQKKYWNSIPNIMNEIHKKVPTY